MLLQQISAGKMDYDLFHNVYESVDFTDLIFEVATQ